MGGDDWGNYSNRPNQYDKPVAPPPAGPQPADAPSPATGAAPPAQVAAPPPADAAIVSPEGQAAASKSDWPPRIPIFPVTTNAGLEDLTSALNATSEKLDQDLASGASPETIDADAGQLKALLAVQVARDKMDKAVLDAFDQAMESARKMMEKYKEWVNTVKLPQQMQQQEELNKKHAQEEAVKHAVLESTIQASQPPKL